MIIVACLARAVEEDFSPLGVDTSQFTIGLSPGRTASIRDKLIGFTLGSYTRLNKFASL